MPTMPRLKRPLSEADPNALNASRKSAKRFTQGAFYDDWKLQQVEERRKQRKEDIEYRNKDNSKLRRFLSERCLPTDGNREELIQRLESSSIDYEALQSATITEMLKDRNVIGASQGNMKYKIERLRINDKNIYDTGNSHETGLYARLSVWEEILTGNFDKPAQDYSKLNPSRLSTLLEQRKLAISGSREVIIRRLENHDRRLDQNQIQKIRFDHDRVKNELEERTGRSIVAWEVIKQGEKLHAADIQFQQAAHVERPQPTRICDYDWKDSHWAERTERELAEICQRREMPGHGPKAAMIKWLDTGNVDYEDLYITGLHHICSQRNVKSKSGDKKADLVRRLREADEASDG